MIISVHIPRTAGSSFRAYLRSHQNLELKEDYGDPILVPTWIRNTYAGAQAVKERIIPSLRHIDCLHGHFLPMKYGRYAKHPEVKFITWLRDPAERLWSQYQYCFVSDKSVDRSPFQNRVAKEQWTFERFYSHASVRNLYKKFLWRFPIEQFDFIGLVEHYTEDFNFICQTYFHDDQSLPVISNQTGITSIDSADRQRIQELHHDDYLIYQQGKTIREERYRKSMV